MTRNIFQLISRASANIIVLIYEPDIRAVLQSGCFFCRGYLFLQSDIVLYHPVGFLRSIDYFYSETTTKLTH